MNDTPTPTNEAPTNILQLGPLKINTKPVERPLIVSADAQGRIKAAPPTPPTPQDEAFTPFPDGVLFRNSPNSSKPGTFIIHDAAGVVVALCKSIEVADILCKGAHLFFQYAQREVAKAQAKDPSPSPEAAK